MQIHATVTDVQALQSEKSSVCALARDTATLTTLCGAVAGCFTISFQVCSPCIFGVFAFLIDVNCEIPLYCVLEYLFW